MKKWKKRILVIRNQMNKKKKERGMKYPNENIIEERIEKKIKGINKERKKKKKYFHFSVEGSIGVHCVLSTLSLLSRLFWIQFQEGRVASLA
jgi:uncharacterized FlaG/YvyC family protein